MIPPSQTLLLVGVLVLCLGISAQNPPKPPATTTTTTPTPSPPTTPTTTTTAAPVTTPEPIKPSPKYPGNEGKWTLEDDKNVTCIMLKGALELSVLYTGNDTKNYTATVDIPIHGVSVSGDCLKGILQLDWNVTSPDASATIHGNTIQFLFDKNETATGELSETAAPSTGISPGKFALVGAKGELYKDPAAGWVNDTSPDTAYKFSIEGQAAFQTPLNHSYSCMQEEKIKAEGGFVTLKLSDIRLEAFRKTPPGQRVFSSAIDCPADDASDVVPIAVGAALAGLVVIVLIAYLVGRRRSRSRGYQSV